MIMIKKLLLFLPVILGVTLLFSSNTYATTDFTLDNTASSYTFCGVGETACSEVLTGTYLKVVINYTDTTKCYQNGNLEGANNGSTPLYPSCGTYFYPVANMNFAFVRFKNLNRQPGTISFDVVDTIGTACPTVSGSINITENGTFDVSSYASAIVNVPVENVTTELTPYSNLVVDSFWQYHKAFAGAVAGIIVIFLVYRLLKGRLK